MPNNKENTHPKQNTDYKKWKMDQSIQFRNYESKNGLSNVLA